MTQDTYLSTALQLGKDQNHGALVLHIRRGLWDQRPSVLPVIASLVNHSGEHIRTSVFDAMVLDSGIDLMPSLIQIFQTTRNTELVESRLCQLVTHNRPEIMDLVDALEPILGKAHEKALRRTQGKLRARFRQYWYMRSFEKSEGKSLHEVADAMVKDPHQDYLALGTWLVAGPPQKCREAARILQKIPQPGHLADFIAAIKRLLADIESLWQLSDLPFLEAHGHKWSARRLLYSLAEQPNHPLTTEGADKLIEKFTKGITRSDLQELMAPYPLSGPIQLSIRNLFAHIITGTGDFPTRETIVEQMRALVEDINDALRMLMLCGSQMAEQFKSPDFAEQVKALLPGNKQLRTLLMIWFYAGMGSSGSKHLRSLFAEVNEENNLKELLQALAYSPLDYMPDEVILLTRDINRHALRRAALEYLASTPLGHAHLSKLMEQAPLVVKDDVGATIVRHHLEDCVPSLLGLLNSKMSDSYRLIILKTLAPFGECHIGLPVRTFLMSGHSLPVRLAALQTLYHGGGPQRLKFIIDTLKADDGIRHRGEILTALLDQIISDDVLSFQGELLLERLFFEDLLNFPERGVRYKTLTLLEFFDWLPETREGWVSLMQRCLQSLVSSHEEQEKERLRSLIEKVSAMFESERKAISMKKRMDSIVAGLGRGTRMERLGALRQLDWIFRPEMIAGDPEGVKRLVKYIEKVMDCDHDDSIIATAAIEVAGKIGHPALRKKIREYLDHVNPELVKAAMVALEFPVNKELLSNLIKSVFHIDDSTYMTRMVGSILNKEGYLATGANEPEEAIALLRNADYDLLILDLNMPKIRGVDFLRTIRGMDLAPRFIFVLTSVRNNDDLTEVFKEGVDGVLLKPFQAEDLVTKVRELKEKCG